MSNPTTNVMARTKAILPLLKLSHPDKTRYAMNGLHVTTSGEMVATNGKALMHVTLKGDVTHAPEKDTTYSAKSIRALFKGSKKGENRNISTCETLPGNFPPFGDLLSGDYAATGKQNETDFNDPRALAEVLATCASFGSGARFVVGDRETTITMRVPEVGDLTLKTHAVARGNGVEAGFDPGLLLDTLNAFKALSPDGKIPQSLSLSWPRRANDAIVLRYGNAHYAATGLVMPLNLG